MKNVRSQIPWPIHPAIPEDHYEGLYKGELEMFMATPVIPPLPIAPFGLELVNGEDKLDGLVRLGKAFVDHMMTTIGCMPLCMLLFCAQDPLERLKGPLCYATGHRPGADMVPRDKDLIAHLARTTALGGQARACMMLAESWTVRTKDKASLDRWFEKHDSLEGHPDVTDCVTMMIEHARGTRTLTSDIRSDPMQPGRARMLSPWIDDGFMNGGGRFADILNPPEKKVN